MVKKKSETLTSHNTNHLIQLVHIGAHHLISRGGHGRIFFLAKEKNST